MNAQRHDLSRQADASPDLRSPERSFLAPPPDGEVEQGAVPTFSVVVTAYQVAEFLGEALASALNQTLAPLEVIVVDDGSTDDVEGALKPYRDGVTLVRQENQGEGAAKAAGASIACGDFISFLDGDDLYEPERLEALGQLATARPDLDILATDAYVQIGDRLIRQVYEGTWTFEARDQRSAILERCFILGHAAVKRGRYLEVGGFDPEMRTVADWDLWIRLILSGSSVGFIPEPLSRWRVREGSLSTSRVGIFQGSLRALEKAADRADLSPQERQLLHASLRTWKSKAELEGARVGLAHGEPGMRARLVKIALRRSVPPRARAKVIASAIAPKAAGRALKRRQEQYWVGAAEERVPRTSSDAKP